ncbi:MAG: beta-ketoacyl-[acyl-carrier-protein] synthase family protein [Deltaproteobacteria bacterium]|nr:beta-ketoacyl-[acyl-carrier-protein] synthase family protein [Deltaproteobacteria bacterium]
MRSVVATGIGIITPMDSGAGLAVFWDGITSGRDTIKEVSAFSCAPYPTHAACEAGAPVSGPRWLAFLDRAMRDALDDSGVDPGSANLGLYLGTVLGGIIEGQKAWADSIEAPPSYYLHGGVDYLRERYGIAGRAATVSTACASGTDAIGMARRSILWGETDVAIAGGADAFSEFAFSGFSALRALTKGRVRPFDKGRDGLALSEGACLLVLEEEQAAMRRGARIYGRIAGYASRADGRHLSAPDREGRGLASAILAALKEGGITAPDYINAHGTGTIYNDAMETRAIKLAFGMAAYDIPVSSIKSMIGHSFGAGGAIEAAACLLALKNGVMPPTINYQERDPECDLDYVPNSARKGDIKTAVSLSAGFGGQNSALIFERAGGGW